MKKILSFIIAFAMIISMSSVALAAGETCANPSTCSHVAAVGNMHYTDIQDAIKDAASGGTVELLDNVTVTEWKMFSEDLTHAEIITVKPINVTINGNGKTLTIKNIVSGGNGGYLFRGDATKLNIKDLTINYEAGVKGGICMTSGTIENVTINGGNGIFPRTGDVTITGCTFNTNGRAVYYEHDGENLVITGNEFATNVADDDYAIILSGKATFTGNTFTKGGGINVAGNASGEISGNNFGNQLFRVYREATADISNNTINKLVIRDGQGAPQATFTDNTLSEAAEDALEAVGATNNVTAPAPSAKPASTGNGISVKYNGGNSFSTSNSAVPTGVEIDGVAVPFSGTGSNFTVGCVDPGAKWVTVRWNSTSVTTNFTPDGLVECSVSIPKTGDMPVWAAVLALFGF